MPEAQAGQVTSETNETPVVPEKVELETPAAVAEENTVDDGVVTPESETTEQQEAHKQSKFQRRLERQKTARIQAETERDVYKKQLEELEAQRKPSGSDEPQRDQFSDYESYLRAITKFDAKQVASETLKTEREASGKQSKEAESQQAQSKNWEVREKAFIGTTKDYEEVVSAFVEDDIGQLSSDARRLIVDSDTGPQLLYHLANHPDVMERLADLSSVRQIAELGKLEDKLSTPAKKTTNAPVPANHVNTGKTGQKDPAKMNQVEYKAWMKANGSRFA